MLYAIKRDVFGGAVALLPLTVPTSLAGSVGAYVITHDLSGSLKAGACILCTTSSMWMTYAMVDYIRNKTLKKHDAIACGIAGLAGGGIFCEITDTPLKVLAMASAVSLFSANFVFIPWYLKNFEM